MSIVRIGLGETKGNFAEGYEAIFGKKEKEKEKKAGTSTSEKQQKTEDKKEEKK
jgi:hypothetical protein